LDFDPEYGIPAGRNWERELYAQIRKADALLFLSSAAAVSSRWCFAEIALARLLNKPVFPIIVERGPRHPLLADTQKVDLAGEGDAAFTRLWAGLRRAGLDPRKAFDWDPTRPPYPGLAAFAKEDAAVFFGREPETERLIQLLQPTLRGRGQFVAVVGPSGTGKSSLVRAGLLPRLARLPRRWLVVPPLVPGNQPTRNLARNLSKTLAAGQTRRKPAELTKQLASGRSALVAFLEELRDATPGELESVLLVIDQAEELMTLAGSSERAAFLDLLREAVHGMASVWVVAALRAEFLSPLLQQAGFAELVDETLAVGPLDRSRLFEVIEGPAARAGLQFAPGLVGRLVEDAEGGDALPLLAYTLHQLHARAGPEGQITVGDYETIGGVLGALRAQADQTAARLAGSGYADLTLPTLLKFVALEFVSVDETEPTRRRVRRSALDEAEGLVVDAFINARLLTSDAVGNDAVIEVAHEALFRQWPPLTQAVEARMDDLRQRAELERWADDWVRSGRSNSHLLRGERLRIAQQWAGAHADSIATELPLVHQYVTSSSQADKATQERLSQAIATRALAIVDYDPEQSILLALAAIEECAPTSLAHRALLAGLSASRVRGVLRGHKGVVRAVTWSPDSQQIATASDDCAVRIWDAEKGTKLAICRGHKDWVRDVAWSPDGRRLATASSDCTGRVWDIRANRLLSVLRGHDDMVRGVAWSRDSRRVATASSDHTVRVWDAETGTELAILRGHEDQVESVAWSRDDRFIATASRDRKARVWDAERGSWVAVLTGHLGTVMHVAWSPDSRLIATASRDRTVRVWDGERGIELAVLRGHQDIVLSVTWSPDGRRLATTSGDRTVRVWDAKRGIELAVLRGHQDIVVDVAWSPDGRRLATASTDRTVRVWDAERGGDEPMLRHPDWVDNVAWSPDGRQLATASTDGNARVWDVEREALHATLHGHEDVVWGLAWSPNGERLATSGDRTARIWNLDPQMELAALRGHDDIVRDVAWSPDGRRLATASTDRTVRIWDAETGTELAICRGHEDVVRAVTWSDDSRRIATASDDRTARIWDAETATELAICRGHKDRGHKDWVRDVAWSPDGRRLATASTDRTVRIWDAETGTELAICRGHEDVVRAVTWSDDSRRIATASDDRTARIWDAETATEITILCVHEQTIEGVAWSANGRRVATASRDRTAQVWNPASDLPALRARAHRRVFRKLTDDERRTAMLPD
jgi:WD40 repeat protein